MRQARSILSERKSPWLADCLAAILRLRGIYSGSSSPESERCRLRDDDAPRLWG